MGCGGESGPVTRAVAGVGFPPSPEEVESRLPSPPGSACSLDAELPLPGAAAASPSEGPSQHLASGCAQGTLGE